MARIAGVDLPKDKRIEAALPYIYGIGASSTKKILAKLGFKAETVYLPSEDQNG